MLKIRTDEEHCSSNNSLTCCFKDSGHGCSSYIYLYFVYVYFFFFCILSSYSQREWTALRWTEIGWKKRVKFRALRLCSNWKRTKELQLIFRKLFEYLSLFTLFPPPSYICKVIMRIIKCFLAVTFKRLLVTLCVHQ